MNYEDMTDEQINEAVTEIVAGDLAKELGVVDYCNDWAYGGLVIQKAKISIQYDYRRSRWDALKAEVCNGGFSHSKPLRAAMIVYLMMQEQK